MKIIYEKNGKLAVVTPTESALSIIEGTGEEKLIAMANKLLPTGTKYEIVEDSDIPSDRSYRDLWSYEAGVNEQTAEDV